MVVLIEAEAPVLQTMEVKFLGSSGIISGARLGMSSKTGWCRRNKILAVDTRLEMITLRVYGYTPEIRQ